MPGYDLANGVLDLPEDPLGFLDAGPRGGPDVQPDLTGVHAREEVLTNAGEQEQGSQGEPEQDGHRHQAVVQRPAEESLVGRPQALELAVERLVDSGEW